MKQTDKWCGCMKTLGTGQALRDIRDEAWELTKARNLEDARDEISDVMYGIGRLLGSFLKKPYVRVLGDGLHISKIEKRMQEYGCIRSKRWLQNGRCPSAE